MTKKKMQSWQQRQQNGITIIIMGAALNWYYAHFLTLATNAKERRTL